LRIHSQDGSDVESIDSGESMHMMNPLAVVK
jgi:hypothetical protein